MNFYYKLLNKTFCKFKLYHLYKNVFNYLDTNRKKKILGISQCPGKNLDNTFDSKLFCKDLDIIKKQNIKIVVSLLTDTEIKKLGFNDSIWSKEGVEYIKFSIKDFGVPTNNELNSLKKLISNIKKNILSSNAILIHCNAGRGRSGMIAAIVLKALKEKNTVNKIRKLINGAIETEEQEKFVREWS